MTEVDSNVSYEHGQTHPELTTSAPNAMEFEGSTLISSLEISSKSELIQHLKDQLDLVNKIETVHDDIWKELQNLSEYLNFFMLRQKMEMLSPSSHQEPPNTAAEDMATPSKRGLEEEFEIPSSSSKVSPLLNNFRQNRPFMDTSSSILESPSRTMTPRSIANVAGTNGTLAMTIRESVLSVRYFSSLASRLITQNQWIQAHVELKETHLILKSDEKEIQMNLTPIFMGITSEKEHPYVLHLRRQDSREECFLSFSGVLDLESWAHDIFACLLRSSIIQTDSNSLLEQQERAKRSFTGSSLLSSMKQAIRKTESQEKGFQRTENVRISHCIPHRFGDYNFITPSRCQKCREMIWPFKDAASRCKYCHYNVHSACAQDAPPNCGMKSFLVAESINHSETVGNEESQGIFGVDLKHSTNDEVPEVVRACIEAVQSRGLNSEGIYRISGTKADIERLKRAFSYGYPNLSDSHDWDDINVIAGVLKLFLRDLPSPLLTFELFEDFVGISSESNREDQLKKLKEILHQLPKKHYNTLKFLMEHLEKVHQNSDENKMTSHNLAVVFGPNLLRSPGESHLIQSAESYSVIQLMIENCHILFNS